MSVIRSPSDRGMSGDRRNWRVTHFHCPEADPAPRNEDVIAFLRASV